MNGGWKEKKLAEITTKIGSGATPLGGEKAYKSEGVSLIRSLNVYDLGFRMKDLAFLDDKQADKLSYVTVESGDVLLNITGASVARCCIVPKDILPAVVNQHVSIIRLIKEEMIPEFLHYALISNEYKDKLLKTGEKGGSTRQAITKAQIEDFSIAYPPIPEQQRIVAILDETFTDLTKVHANADRNRVNAKEVFEAALDETFKQQGENFSGQPLADLCEDSRLITYGVVKLGDHMQDGVPCLRTSNVRWLRIDTDDMKRISPSLSKQYSRTILKGGEVLVNVRGTLGGVAVVPQQMAGWNMSREVAIVPIDKKKIDPHFMSYYIASGISQKWFGGVIKGAAYVGINIEDLRLLPVPVPTLAEQCTLVSRLDSLLAETKKLEEVHQRKLDAVEELRKSILQKAFEGGL